jgi:hypothetical protein
LLVVVQCAVIKLALDLYCTYLTYFLIPTNAGGFAVHRDNFYGVTAMARIIIHGTSYPQFTGRLMVGMR